MRIPTLLALLTLTWFSSAQERPAYQLFNQKGKPTDYGKMLKQAKEADVILFGEYHDNPICHWLQLELTRDLLGEDSLALGAEMFEADNQEGLDAYLKGEVDAKGLDTLVRLWNNYRTDYAPLVDLAKESGIPFIATNIPRRYASLLYKKGMAALDTLSDLEKSWIAPLPFPYDSTLSQYQDMMTMMGDHANPNMPKAQAIKDATMAHFILENMKEGGKFVHYNGSFHSDYFQGIMWYLKNARPDLKVMTISTIQQEDLSSLEAENADKAHFTLCVDADMTSTY